jgi:hypothetical protein
MRHHEYDMAADVDIDVATDMDVDIATNIDVDVATDMDNNDPYIYRPISNVAQIF